MSVAPISLSNPQVTPKQIAAVGFGLIVSGIVLRNVGRIVRQHFVVARTI